MERQPSIRKNFDLSGTKKICYISLTFTMRGIRVNVKPTLGLENIKLELLETGGVSSLTAWCWTLQTVKALVWRTN